MLAIWRLVYGFRTEQFARVLLRMSIALHKREHAVAVLFDMQKAFDRVWHAATGLICKLSMSTTPRRIVKKVFTVLRDRHCRVTVNGVVSIERSIKSGVPQGTCLSHMCYSRYTDDIVAVGGTILASYADGICGVKMQWALDALPPWLKDWRHTVNVAKTPPISVCT